MIERSPLRPSQEGNSDTIIKHLYDRIYSLEQAVSAIGYDAKASKKRRFPQRRRAVVTNGITRALCVETIDPWKENRVRFFHPLLHDPTASLFSLPFAYPVSSMGGFDDSGLNWVPPAGSTIMVFFEGGSLSAPFYIGTTWQRNRGANGQDVNGVFPSREYQAIYQGNRGGYINGPTDESEVLPPWNTESYNASEIDSITQFTTDPLEQQRVTYPNIYGFKTPEKHMLKLTDGDAKCNRRWKRIEMLSGCGNWMIFKDDHLHAGGQWANPSCNSGVNGPAVDVCTSNTASSPYFTNIQGTPLEKGANCGSSCSGSPGSGQTQCSSILGGHSSTPCDPPTQYCKSNTGSNPFFKHQNECRPYAGPGTPQNNRCDLPQSGIQFLSISGHTWVMDDSVEEPRGIPNWQRSTQPFDFGCNDTYLGRMYFKSATGHKLIFSDVEEESQLRGQYNYIQLLSANGNKIELNDHTLGEGNCTACPPNYAGQQRGIHLQSTSNHQINMSDYMNLQCAPCRTEGGVPTPNATQAFIQIRSGYGGEMRFNDDNSQQTTQSQWIQILNPQCAGATDANCNSCGDVTCRGPHFLRFQARPKGQPGIVFLRAGGHSIRQTYDMDIVLVGDKENNPSDKFTYVSRKYFRATEDVDFRYSGQLHVFFAEKQILLMAGRDCPPVPPHICKGPCLYGVVVARCPVICPLTGILHWTEKAVSERVFASAYHPCQVPCGGEGCADYFAEMAAAPDGPCSEDTSTQNIDTGNGTVTVTTPNNPAG